MGVLHGLCLGNPISIPMYLFLLTWSTWSTIGHLRLVENGFSRGSPWEFILFPLWPPFSISGKRRKVSQKEAHFSWWWFDCQLSTWPLTEGRILQTWGNSGTSVPPEATWVLRQHWWDLRRSKVHFMPLGPKKIARCERLVFFLDGFRFRLETAILLSSVSQICNLEGKLFLKKYLFSTVAIILTGKWTLFCF